MYRQNDGRRLADWQGDRGATGSHRGGPSITQRVLGGSAWSFGGIPQVVADNDPSPPARHEEMTRQSPQTYVPKQEYSTPRQQLMRGQHGTPITISSGGSWAHEEYAPARPTLKRAGSPSMMCEIPNKRQQVYTSPGMMQPSRPIPDDARHLFFEEQPQHYQTRYVNEGQTYQQEIPRRFSPSPYEQAPQVRHLHEPPNQRQFRDHQQYLSPHLETRMQPTSYHSSPESQFRVPQHHSPQHRSHQYVSGPHPLKQVVTYEQDREYLRAQSHQHRQVDHYDMVHQNEQQNLRRAMTPGQQSQSQLQNEDGSRNHPGNAPPESPVGRKQQPQLGSPLWPNAKVARKDAPELPIQVRVQGRNVVFAGSVPVPEDQIDRRHVSEIPFTPPRQRAKTPSGSTQRPSSTQRGRSKSVATASIAREVPQPQSQREKTPCKPPSVEDAPEDDPSESTPLNEVLRRQQRQGQVSRNNFEEGSYNVASVLPQESIFSHDRPKATKAKPAMAKCPLPGPLQQSPEVVSLLSTPDGSAASPPLPAVRSVPMKARITPAKKPPAKKSAATPKSASRPKKSTPKTPKVPKKQKAKADAEQPPDLAILMQKRAADLIVTKEIQGADEAMDLDLFGEIVGETEEEKARKEDEIRAEFQRKHVAKVAEMEAREEGEKVAEMEKMRAKSEKEEKERLENEVEEERTKARRDAERKRQEALEERERDELRRKAAEKIEADRKKAAEEAEQRERHKREAKEKVEKVQVDAEELAKLKAKQEEAKKQAASLSAAKISMPDDGEKADGGDKGGNGDVVMEEDSLFLPETEPEPTETDIGSRAKSVGPSSAAQVFAQSNPKAAISAYRAEREEADLRREKLRKESRLNERWKRQEAAKVIQQAPPPRLEPVKERPGPSKGAKKDRPPPKSKAQTVVSPPPSETASIAESAVSQPILPSFISSDNSSFSSNKSARPSLSSKPPQDLKSKVKLISQLELEKIEKEQYAKQTKENEVKKAKRTEQQKENRRKKEDEKARERQKQRIIDEADRNGIDLSEEDLEFQVEAYMAKREADRQRRHQREALKKSVQDFAPDSLALLALKQSQSRASHEVAESHASTADDDEELTLEDQLRRSRAADMKASMEALARQRNSSFARAAAKKTVADFQSDSESEEDPDPEPAPATKNTGTGECDQDLNSEDSDTDDDDANAVKGLNPDEHDAQIVPPLPNMTASFNRRNRSKKEQPEISSAMGNVISNPSNSEHQAVMLYTIKKELTFNGKDCNEVILAQFLSRKEANDYAAAEVQKLRQRPTKSISEGLDDDELYCATVVYDRGDKNQAYIYVTACPMSSGDLVDFDPAKVDNRLEEKTYLVMQFLSQKKVDEETGEVHIHHNEPEILSQFSQLPMANHDACARLIELLKPKNARIDYVEQHTNHWAPKLRELRDKANEERKGFEADIDRDDEQLQWATFDTVKMEVRLFPMKGPRN